MMQCQEQEAPAPRPACGCRKCYRARWRSLDPELIALASFSGTVFISNPSQHLIHKCLDLYLMGRVEWGLLHMIIIKALAEQYDDLFKARLDAVSMRAPNLFS